MKRTNAHIPEEMGLPLFDQAEGAPAPAPFSSLLQSVAEGMVESMTDLAKSFAPCDPNVRDSFEIARLSNQCRAIYARLLEGSATNSELAAISLKYTGRISDLRAAGIEVDVVERDRKSGLTRYALRGAR